MTTYDAPGFSRVADAATQAMSIRYNNLVYDLKSQGEKVITLSLGEAFFDIPLKSMDDLPFPDVLHYSHSRGLPALRRQIASHYASEYGVEVDPETEILITAGSKAAIHFTLMSILDPGDEVIVQEPTWVSYPEQIRLCYGVPVTLPYDAPLSAYEDAITPRTKAIIINNPHNPRGEVMSGADLEYLVDLARRRGLHVLADEAYSDFVLDEPFQSLGRFDPEKRNVAVCNSISKNFGISGWRLGYVISRPEMIDQILKINQHILTCPASILQYYVAEHFEDIRDVTRPQIRDVVRKRHQVAAMLRDLDLVALPGTGTFYLFVSTAPSTLSSEEFTMRLLMEDKVAVVPGIGYGESCDEFVRVSIGTESLEDIAEGLRRLRALIDRTR